VIIMIRKVTIGVLIAALSLTTLTGCQTLTQESNTQSVQVEANTGTTMISELIDLSDRLHFPELEAASELLLSEVGYIENLSRVEDNYFLFNADKNERVVKSEFVQEWTIKERDKLIKLTMEFENQFETFGIKFDDSIAMVKVASGSRLPAVFISNNAIVLSQEAVDLHKDKLKEDLIQTFFKLYMNKHPEMLTELSNMIGFEEVAGIKLPEELIEHILIRPGNVKPFVFEAKRGDVSPSAVYKWVPITFIEPNTQLMKDFMLSVVLTANGEAIVNTIPSENLYLPEIGSLSNSMAVPLNKLEDAYKNLGEFSEDQTHPEDILALNFMYLVLERPVTGTGTIDKLRNRLESK